jgi:hypothetical protein
MPMKDLIFDVLSSWQVLLITVLFFLYWAIVSMAVKPLRSKTKKTKIKKLKRPKEEKVDDKETDASDLGLDG